MATTRRTYLGWTTAGVIGLVGMAAGAASAQVAPPPPSGGEEIEEYVPPAAPQEMTREGREEMKRERRERAEQQRQRREQQQAQSRDRLPALDLPDIPGRTALLKYDEAGNLRRWEQPTDYAALQLNSIVSDGRGELIHATVNSRVDRVEQRVIDNLDLFRAGMGGAFARETVTLDELANLSKAIEPLIEPKTLTLELYQAEALTGMQAVHNANMVAEYRKQLTKSIKLAEGMKQIDALWAFMLTDSMHEPRYVHSMLLGEGLTRLDEVLGAAKLAGSELGGKLVALGSFSGENKPGSDVIREGVVLLGQASMDEHTQFLSAVRATRANPAVTEFIKIDLTSGGKHAMTASKPKVRKEGEKWVEVGDVGKKKKQKPIKVKPPTDG